MTEKEFHTVRKAFAYYDGKLNWCPSGLSHYEWLVDGGILQEAQFDDIVRGYTYNGAIYFYSGDFETNEYVEDIAKMLCNSIDMTSPVYCGLVKGKIGDQWEPIKRIR